MTVIGCGTVGLVAAACFAAAGHAVLAVEVDPARLEALRAGGGDGEPGLDGLVRAAVAAGRLRFGPRPDGGAEVVVVAVPTPPDPDGAADLGALREAIGALGEAGERPAVVLVKSTVPPGTWRRVAGWLAEAGLDRAEVVANPEFLRVGHAVSDFRAPDRLVIGTRSATALAVVERLYAGLPEAAARRVVVGPGEAELAKLAANGLLAQRVAFANEIARLGDALGVDPTEALAVVGRDARLGPSHLRPSVGFGGSCLPKDAAALWAVGRQAGLELPLIAAASRSNEAHLDWVLAALGAVGGRPIAVWGLAFKPGTADVRDSRAVALAGRLVDLGAEVRVHDPAAAPPPGLAGRVRVAPTPEAAAEGADAVVIATAWPAYATAPLPPGVRLLDPSGLREVRWTDPGTPASSRDPRR